MSGYILMVEDDLKLADVVQSALTNRGYQVTHVSTCADAAAEISRERPSLLMLDVGLPDGDGLSLLSSLRTHLLTEEAPVIVVSSNQVSRSDIRRLSIQRYVAKPFSVPDLVSIVETYLEP